MFKRGKVLRDKKGNFFQDHWVAIGIGILVLVIGFILYKTLFANASGNVNFASNIGNWFGMKS